LKIVRFSTDNRPRYGILENERVRTITGAPFHAIKLTGESHPVTAVRLRAPCTPSKIVALGVNYRSHAQEMKSQLPKNPLIFLKPSSAVIGPEDQIVYPPTSLQVDYEGELAVVIRKRARGVTVEQAKDYILGYTCLNDVTARDLQRLDGQWTRAKGFDTFCPMGPWIETELDDTELDIETYRNGRLVQKGNTRDLVFGVPELVSFVSHVMTLLPGDVIATGTPGGVGPVQPGDTVEVRISQIGALHNRIVRGT
jgi:2-keto-4-pentenoate hydratase/2-oxohepta-3-ene-1,7-dioic acid hydratase in catechol pathway